MFFRLDVQSTMLTTRNCCFCVGLRTGSLIIGWLHLILSITGILAYLIMITQNGNDQDYVIQKSPSIFWFDAALTVVKAMMAISLLYGIYTEQKQFVLYYVYFMIFSIIVYIIILVVFLANASIDAVALVIIIVLIGFLITAYLIVVVYSLYKEMEGHN